MDSILDKVVLTDVLTAPTVYREEKETVDDKTVSDSPPESSNTEHFEPIVQQEETFSNPKEEEKVQAVKEEEEPFDPEESAESAIDIIDLINQMIFMPLGSRRLLNKFGGREKLQEMKAVVEKQLNQEELSDAEKNLLNLFNAYKTQNKEIRASIPFEDEDIRALKPSTIKFCKKHGIKVNENLAFAAGLTKVLSKRAITIFTD